MYARTSHAYLAHFTYFTPRRHATPRHRTPHHATPHHINPHHTGQETDHQWGASLNSGRCCPHCTSGRYELVCTHVYRIDLHSMLPVDDGLCHRLCWAGLKFVCRGGFTLHLVMLRVFKNARIQEALGRRGLVPILRQFHRQIQGEFIN